MPNMDATYAPATLARYAAALAAQRRRQWLGKAIARAARRHDLAAIKRLGEQARQEQAAWQQLVKGA